MNKSILEETALRTAHANKLIAFSALSRLQRIVDETMAEDRWKRCLIGKLSIAFSVFVLAVIVWASIDSGSLVTMLRGSISLMR